MRLMIWPARESSRRMSARMSRSSDRTGSARVESHLGGLGVVHDGAKRLAQLVSEGSAQLSQGRPSIEVRRVVQVTLGLLLCDLAPATLEYEPDDEQGLHDAHPRGHDHVRTVVAPQLGGMELDVANG